MGIVVAVEVCWLLMAEAAGWKDVVGLAREAVGLETIGTVGMAVAAWR